MSYILYLTNPRIMSIKYFRPSISESAGSTMQITEKPLFMASSNLLSFLMKSRSFGTIRVNH